MSGFDLDVLVRALQVAVCNAQRAVREQQEGTLKSMTDVGGGGELAQEAGTSLLGLQHHQIMEISAFSVECDCRIRRGTRRRGQDADKLVVTPCRRGKRPKRDVHSVRMTVRDASSGEGDVTVDGVAVSTVNAIGSQLAGSERGARSSCLSFDAEWIESLQERRGAGKWWSWLRALLVRVAGGLVSTAVAASAIRMGP